jgi:hypothetical protein
MFTKKSIISLKELLNYQAWWHVVKQALAMLLVETVGHLHRREQRWGRAGLVHSRTGSSVVFERHSTNLRSNREPYM